MRLHFFDILYLAFVMFLATRRKNPFARTVLFNAGKQITGKNACVRVAVQYKITQVFVLSSIIPHFKLQWYSVQEWYRIRSEKIYINIYISKRCFS